MKTLHRIRRLLLATLVALAALAASTARADIAPSPTLVHVVGQRATVRAGEPDRATFELENVSGSPIEVFLYRAVLNEGTRFPLTIRRVEIDGQPVGRDVTVPARGRIEVTVFFDLPSSLHGRSRWRVDLRVTTDAPGRVEGRPATLQRGGPHKLSAGVPKRIATSAD